MSNSVTASTNDVTSAYWNPAGLNHIGQSWQAAAMHAEYFAGIGQYDYLAFAKRLDKKNTVAVSMVRFGVDNILNTTQLIDENGNVDYDRITKFTAADYALIGSLARTSEKVENLRYGLNVKLIYRQIGDFARAFGFGFDLGAQYDLGKWQVGANLRDATSTFNAWSYTLDDFEDVFEQTGNELPDENLELTLPSLNLGIGRKFKLNDKYTLQPELNAEFTFGGKENTLVSADFGNISPSFGTELGYKNLIFLRGGIGNIQKVTDINNKQTHTLQPNVGVGFLYHGVSIDYAFADIGDASGNLYTNIISVKFDMAQFKKL